MVKSLRSVGIRSKAQLNAWLLSHSTEEKIELLFSLLRESIQWPGEVGVPPTGNRADEWRRT